MPRSHWPVGSQGTDVIYLRTARPEDVTPRGVQPLQRRAWTGTPGKNSLGDRYNRNHGALNNNVGGPDGL